MHPSVAAVRHYCRLPEVSNRDWRVVSAMVKLLSWVGGRENLGGVGWWLRPIALSYDSHRRMKVDTRAEVCTGFRSHTCVPVLRKTRTLNSTHERWPDSCISSKVRFISGFLCYVEAAVIREDAVAIFKRAHQRCSHCQTFFGIRIALGGMNFHKFSTCIAPRRTGASYHENFALRQLYNPDSSAETFYFTEASTPGKHLWMPR